MKYFLLILVFSGLLSGKTYSQVNAVPFTFNQIQTEGDLGSFVIEFSSMQLEEGLEIVHIELNSDYAAVPPTFKLKWDFPSTGISQFWNSKISTDKVTYYINDVQSRASSQVPLIDFIGNQDQNRFLFAFSDALNKINTTTWLREEDRRFYCEVELFSEPHPAINNYHLDIRIDRRNTPFYKAISESTQWWADMEYYIPAPVPNEAKLPMYSTWYSFHQNLDFNEVVRECRLGKEIGLEAVIIDDGWQTMDNKRGYAYTGDWEPDRIGNMKAFVDSIHSIGMKVLLWYSLPFIGEKAKIFPKFEGKYLHHWESQGTWVVDPRYPEVREHIINTYETALKEWQLDGFKLDFLGWFYADEKTDMTTDNGRDFASVNEATDKLMTDIMSRLKAIKPEIMIEFRQPYIGPLMRKYGNMFRAADCPNMAIVNRVRTTDLRIASGNTAVHSDMFVWNELETVEDAALQILNILFSVPQLSVKLDSINEDQFQMAKFWINYWKENREVLLDGIFQPEQPAALYPIIRATKNQKTIVGLYNKQLVSIMEESNSLIDIVNASGSDEIVIDLINSLGPCSIEISNCMGKIEEVKKINLKTGLYKFKCPLSGLIQIRQL